MSNLGCPGCYLPWGHASECEPLPVYPPRWNFDYDLEQDHHSSQRCPSDGGGLAPPWDPPDQTYDPG